MFRCLIVLVGCLLMVGCAAVAPVGPVTGSLLGGAPPQVVHQQTSLNLSQDNFILVRTNVFGVSKGLSLLGFITISPATLSTAMDRMYASAQMRPGEPQTVANLVVERSGSFWILFGIPKVEVHADVVEFRPGVGASKKARPK